MASYILLSKIFPNFEQEYCSFKKAAKVGLNSEKFYEKGLNLLYSFLIDLLLMVGYLFLTIEYNTNIRQPHLRI